MNLVCLGRWWLNYIHHDFWEWIVGHTGTWCEDCIWGNHIGMWAQIGVGININHTFRYRYHGLSKYYRLVRGYVMAENATSHRQGLAKFLSFYLRLNLLNLLLYQLGIQLLHRQLILQLLRLQLVVQDLHLHIHVHNWNARRPLQGRVFQGLRHYQWIHYLLLEIR